MNALDEKYCILCDKLGHLTTQCWSTHGLNTPRNREIFRLCEEARKGKDVLFGNMNWPKQYDQQQD